jgi:hypothetical protein
MSAGWPQEPPAATNPVLGAAIDLHQRRTVAANLAADRSMIGWSAI